MIQVNRIYLIFNRLVTKKFLMDTSVLVSLLRILVLVLPMIECFHLYFRKVQR